MGGGLQAASVLSNKRRVDGHRWSSEMRDPLSALVPSEEMRAPPRKSLLRREYFLIPWPQTVKGKLARGGALLFKEEVLSGQA